MGRYQRQLQVRYREEWMDEYVDYVKLKRALIRYLEQEDQKKDAGNRSSTTNPNEEEGKDQSTFSETAEEKGVLGDGHVVDALEEDNEHDTDEEEEESSEEEIDESDTPSQEEEKKPVSAEKVKKEVQDETEITLKRIKKSSFISSLYPEVQKLEKFVSQQAAEIRQNVIHLTKKYFPEQKIRLKKLNTLTPLRKAKELEPFGDTELKELRKVASEIKAHIEHLKLFVAMNTESLKRVCKLHDATLRSRNCSASKSNAGKYFMYGIVYKSKFYRGRRVLLWEHQLDELVFTASTAGQHLSEEVLTRVLTPNVSPTPRRPGEHRHRFGGAQPTPLQAIGSQPSTTELSLAAVTSGKEAKSPVLAPSGPSEGKLEVPKGESLAARKTMLKSKRDATVEEVPLLPEGVTLKEYIDDLPPGTLSRVWVPILNDACNQKVSVPMMIAKGIGRGPIMGLTAALHGNELNGINLIFRLFDEIELQQLCGSVVAVTVTNPSGYTRHQREYEDGRDLNRLFPGRADGTGSQIFCYRLLERVVKHFDYLCDLHTASFGRVNALYTRCNMNEPAAARMAMLQNAQIVVHNDGVDGSLRGAASRMGIPAITVEIGNPQTFQRRYIRHALIGCTNVLSNLNMYPVDVEPPLFAPVICTRSYWVYTDAGGILTVFPELCALVQKNQLLAVTKDLFGRVIRRYYAKEDGVIIGKNGNPSAPCGARIAHIGVTGTTFPKHVDDGHL